MSSSAFSSGRNVLSRLTVTTGPLNLKDNVELALGDAPDSALDHSTVQTNDGLVWGLGGTRALIFCEYADRGVDFALAVLTNPAIVVQSADAANPLQRILAYHNQTHGVVESHAGGLRLVPASGALLTSGTSLTADAALELAAGGAGALRLTSGSGSILTAATALLADAALQISTGAATDLQLLPGAGGITRVGTGVPAHLAGPTNNDFYVGGRAEFASYNHFTGITYARNRLICCAGPGTILVQMGQYAASHIYATWVAQTTDGLHLCLSGTVGGAQRNLILTDVPQYNRPHGHSALSPHPTLWPHSVRDVRDSNREWGQIVHDGDDFIRGSGKGGHKFTVDDQAARCKWTVTGAPALDQGFTLNLTTFCAKDAQDNAADQFLRTGTVTEIAEAIVDVINNGSESANARAWNEVGIVYVEWGTAGVIGNAIVSTETLDNVTFDAVTLGTEHKGIAAATRIHAPSDGDITLTPESAEVVVTGLVAGSTGLRTVCSTDNVSDPPTDAELDAAFGTPAIVGAGFVGTLDDAGAGASVFAVISDGTNWFYTELTKAL